MSARATLLLEYKTSGSECSGVKLEVQEAAVDPGEAVEIRLWGASAELLAGYALFQGATGLGQGTLLQRSGQREVAYLDFAGRKARQLEYPFLRLASARAFGDVFERRDDVVSLVVANGADLSGALSRSGYSCVAVIPGGPELRGAVRVETERSPHVRTWLWTVPESPDLGEPEGCPEDVEADERDAAKFWFFLYRHGVLIEEFALELAEYESTECEFCDFRNWEIVENDSGLTRFASVRKSTANRLVYMDDPEAQKYVVVYSQTDLSCSDMGID